MYNFRPETYKWVTPAIIVYILDRVVRRLRMSTHEVDISENGSRFLDKGVLELSVPKPFDYQPGQYVGKFSTTNVL